MDSANSSQKPKEVIDEISRFYETEFSNVGRSVHTLAVKATNKFEETRDIVKSYVNAKYREEIIFTKGATEAINLVANTYGEKFIKKGDEILVTELEHHSNYVPWHYLRKKKGAVIKFSKPTRLPNRKMIQPPLWHRLERSRTIGPYLLWWLHPKIRLSK